MVNLQNIKNIRVVYIEEGIEQAKQSNMGHEQITNKVVCFLLW